MPFHLARFAGWRPQFTLGALFGVMTIVAVVAAWITVGERNRKAVRAVEALGATITYASDEQSFNADVLARAASKVFPRAYVEDVTGIHLEYYIAVPAPELAVLAQFPALRNVYIDAPRAGDSFRYLRSLQHLERLEIWGDVSDDNLARLHGMATLKVLDCPLEELSPDSLKQLGSLIGLESLCMCGAQFGDAEVPILCALKRLRHLDLTVTRISDVGVKELLRCREIETLMLDSTQVTGACLAELPKFPRLRFLELTGIPIADAELAPLADCAALELVDVRQTGVSRAAIESLRAKRPALRVLGDDEPRAQGVMLPHEYERFVLRQ